MTVARAWWLRAALAGVAVVAAVALFRLAGSAFGTASYPDCDNLAGTCLRLRQQDALKALGAAAAVLALCCLWIASAAVRRRPRAWHAAAAALALALAGTAAATDPVHHLDNRYHGRLSDPSGR